jgi:acetyltransferase-like isoleucine patch superfamily enzyme
LKPVDNHHLANSGQDAEFDRMIMRLTTSGGPGLSRENTKKGWEIIDVASDRRGILGRLFRRFVHETKSLYWRRRFRKFGRRTWIESPNWIRGACSISIGSRVSLWRYARLSAVGSSPERETISIGDGTVIHPFVHIAAAKSVTIGENVLFAANCYVTDHDHDWLDPSDPPLVNKKVIAVPTSIGDHTWLGEKVAVLKGVRIGKHCVIGANSVVTTDIPPYSVAVGAPARVVRRWDHVLESWIPVRNDKQDDVQDSQASRREAAG